MTRKKAEGLEPFEIVANGFLFSVFFLFTMFALSLSGCGSNKIDELESDKGIVAELRASEQLTAYLATAIPVKDVLYKRIDEAEDKFNTGTPFNSVKAKEFLDEHPEVYVERNYAEFIAAVYAYRDDGRVKDAFDAVTKAVFYRPSASKGKRDLTEGLDKIYYSPIISVLYGSYKGLAHGSRDLVFISGEDYPAGTGAYAFRQLPTHDMKGLTVRFEIHSEDSSEPLP